MRGILVAAMLAFGVVVQAGGQQEVVVEGDASPACVIEWEPGHRLSGGGLDEDAWVPSFGGLEELPEGRFLVWPILGSSFLEISNDGSTRRWIGGEGEGPGEFRDVSWVRWRDERLHVFDQWNMRRTVLDAETHEVVATSPLHLTGSLCCGVIVLDDGSAVVGAESFLPERIGYALHRLDASGEVAASFDEGPVLLGVTPPRARHISRSSRDEHVWSVPLDEYRLELWDAVAGIRARTVARESHWFPPREADDDGFLGPGDLGRGAMHGIHEDARGRLWIVLDAPTRDRWPARCFEPLTPAAARRLGFVEGSMPEHRLRDECRPSLRRRVEVIDPSSGKMIASHEEASASPAMQRWMTHGGTFYSLDHDAFGFPIIQLWTPMLRAGRGGDAC